MVAERRRAGVLAAVFLALDGFWPLLSVKLNQQKQKNKN
jgi:hypothetical protein